MMLQYVMLILSVVSTQGSDSGGLTLIAKARPGQVYVGQAFEITLDIVGTQELPNVVIPAIEGAGIVLVGTDSLPSGSGASGDQVFVKNRYRLRYRVVPRRAGTLVVPPFVATLDDQSGASSPLKWIVKAVPLAGRTSDYLGGIGAFEVDASASPSSLRRGQTFEYRISVRGSGAAGIQGAPILARLQRIPLGLEIEKTSDVALADFSLHTFVYRIRAKVAGEATLPPVPITAFDPETQRYITHVARGVPIRVTDIPGFDESKISFPAPSSSDPAAARSGRLPVVLSVSSFALLVAGATLVLTRRKHTRGNVIRVMLRVQVERVQNARNLQDLATAIMEGFVACLTQANGREAGALTPQEAEEGIARATGSAATGQVARVVVEECDAVLYGGIAPDLVVLRTQSLGLFKALGANSESLPT